MYCHKPGHQEDECWNKHKDKRPDNISNKNKNINPNKHSHHEEAHKGQDADEEGEEIVLQSEVVTNPHCSIYMADILANHTSSANITSPINVTSWDDDLINVVNMTQNEEILLREEEEEAISLGENADKDLHNYVNNTVVSTSNQDRSLYDWIANSASTLHICNKHEVFTEYSSIKNEIPIYGVGNITTTGIERGKIVIQAIHNGKTHKIILNDVLHVPNNCHNILSLEQWAHAGGTFKGGPEITLISPNGIEIAKGILITNNLFQIKFRYYYPTHLTTQPQYNFISQEHKLTWETWHKCFRHVSYMGLMKLHSQKLVNGFNVNIMSPKLNCSDCTAAKHSKKPFGLPSKQISQSSKLTHADLWGKYDTISINGCQYYLLLIDNAT